MRIQVRLTRESETILREEKESYRRRTSATATYGWLVNKITKKVFPLVDIIDWQLVYDTQLNLVSDDGAFNTALNLETAVLDNISTMQVKFKEFFGTGFHKAYVIRLILRANYMMNANENVMKTR